MAAKKESSNRRLLLAVGLCAAAVGSAVIGYGSMYNSGAGMASEAESDYVIDEDEMHEIIEYNMNNIIDELGHYSESDSDGGDSESDGDEVTIDKASLEALVDAVVDLQKQMASMEERMAAEEADTAEVEKYSSFAIEGPKSPSKNYALPDTFVEFRGRTIYKLKFKLRINSVPSYWGNILHVGDADFNRGPGIWMYGGHRRVHFVQALEGIMHSNGYPSVGCDPAESTVPATGEFFTVEVVASAQRYEIKYNGESRCSHDRDVIPLAGRQTVWFSNPWHAAAAVTVKKLKYEIKG